MKFVPLHAFDSPKVALYLATRDQQRAAQREIVDLQRVSRDTTDRNVQFGLRLKISDLRKSKAKNRDRANRIRLEIEADANRLNLTTFRPDQPRPTPGG